MQILWRLFITLNIKTMAPRTTHDSPYTYMRGFIIQLAIQDKKIAIQKNAKKYQRMTWTQIMAYSQACTSVGGIEMINYTILEKEETCVCLCLQVFLCIKHLSVEVHIVFCMQEFVGAPMNMCVQVYVQMYKNMCKCVEL